MSPKPETETWCLHRTQVQPLPSPQICGFRTILCDARWKYSNPNGANHIRSGITQNRELSRSSHVKLTFGWVQRIYVRRVARRSALPFVRPTNPQQFLFADLGEWFLCEGRNNVIGPSCIQYSFIRVETYSHLHHHTPLLLSGFLHHNSFIWSKPGASSASECCCLTRKVVNDPLVEGCS